MTQIIPMIVAATFFALTPKSSDARPSTCLLSVEGEAYIDGACDFTLLSGTDGDFRITGPDGKYFAYLYVKGKDTGDAHWNGAIGESRAHTPLGMLKREGACWSNDTAKLCAW